MMYYQSTSKLEADLPAVIGLERNQSCHQLNLQEFIEMTFEPEVMEITPDTYSLSTGEVFSEMPIKHDVSLYLNLEAHGKVCRNGELKVQQNYEVEETTDPSFAHLRQVEEEEEPSSTQEPGSLYDEEQAPFGKNTRVSKIRSRPNRDLTTIAKVIFTPFKKQLIAKSCPIDLKPYFNVCPYSRNHRMLLDFELPYLYAELLDVVRPGSLEQFRNYLNNVNKDIIDAAVQAYGSSNEERLLTFKTYLNRIYKAYNCGLDCAGRMQILYNHVSNPKVTHKLAQLKARLAEQVNNLA